MTGENDVAVRSREDGFADGQAEAGASGFSATGRIASIEAIEDVRERGGFDAVTTVFDTEFRDVFVLLDDGVDLRACRAVLQGVQEQVGAEQTALFGVEIYKDGRCGGDDDT